MIVQATIDLDKVGMTPEQWSSFIGDNFWFEVEQKPSYSNHLRDMTQGWQRLCTVEDWNGEVTAWDNGWRDPGVYALVYDKDNKGLHPVLSNRTLCFGETTQHIYKRVNTHVLALKGRVSNMTEKWSKYDKVVNKAFNFDVRNELDKVWIWYRPHHLTDKDWAFDRSHSCLMEKQAHAQYKAFWFHGAPANTRDLPDYDLVQRSKKFLLEKYPHFEKYLTN